MPKVKGEGKSAKAKPKRKPITVPVTADGEEEVRVSSVLFGLALIIGLMVAGAAWMGGSLSQLERRFGNMLDSAARTTGLAVQNVTVEGVEGPLAAEIRAAALIEPGENMFRADPYRIRRQIEDSELAASVQVHRFWPDNILIIATAAEPAAYWESEGRMTVVDTLGQPVGISAAQATPSELLQIGGNGADVALPGLLSLMDQYPSLKPRVIRAQRVAGIRWELHLHTGASLILPEDANAGQALARLVALQDELQLLDRPITRVDVSNPARTVIAPAEPRLAVTDLAVEDS